MEDRKIKVLVVEDSNSVQLLLVHLLNSDPRLQVIGTAANGREALDFLEHQAPDVILMDVDMPKMGGFEATRLIMETRPTPIVICCGSGKAREDTTTNFRVMEVGALALVDKPVSKEQENFDSVAGEMLQTVRLMSEVKVVRRWPRLRAAAAPRAAANRPHQTAAGIRLIGIGASTGGPPVLQTILGALPRDFAVPILVVQHISPGFLEGMVEWLNQTTGLTVHVAAHEMLPLPGHVYLAPDNFHMMVGKHGRILLRNDEPVNGLRPSVSHLFRSMADVCRADAMGVLLTGMGRDGAIELRHMRDQGAATIVQDRATSVIHGMPGAAIALGAATLILAPDKIAQALIAHANPGVLRQGGSR